MRPLVYVEPGGEVYVRFIERKLAEYHAHMIHAGTRSLSRTYYLADGTRIYIHCIALGQEQFRDTVRILRASLAGRIRFAPSEIIGNDRYRWYLLGGSASQLKYAETTSIVPLALSFDGTTSIANESSGRLAITRKNKNPAYINGTFGKNMGAGLASTTGDVLDNRIAKASSGSTYGTDPITTVWLNANSPLNMGAEKVTETGAYVMSTLPPSESPSIYSVSETATDTQATLVTSGIPAFVTAFYAGRSVPHYLHQLTATWLMPLVDRGTYYRTIPRLNVSGGQVIWLGSPQATQTLDMLFGYDRLADAPVLFVRMPYAQSLSVDGGNNATYVFADRYELRRYNFGTGTWTLIYSLDWPTIVNGTMLEDAAYAASAGDFVANTRQVHNGLTTVADVGYTSYLTPSGRTTPGTAGGQDITKAQGAVGRTLSLAMVYITGSDGAQVINANGAVRATVPGVGSFTRMRAYAASGLIVSYTTTGLNADTAAHWIGAWGNTALSNASAGYDIYFMSPTGNKLWVDSTGAYYENGAPAVTMPLSAAAPAANAGSFALYGNKSLQGFYFLDFIAGWHIPKDAVKMRVYTRVLHPTPTTYTWEIKTILAKWNAVTLKFDILYTYSDIATPVKSRGPYVEFIPGLTTINLTEAQLTQNELLTRTWP